MLLTKMSCNGCGRKPTFGEWFRGELTANGYQDWRHHGVILKRLGHTVTPTNRKRYERLYQHLFQRALPDEGGALCPACQEKMRQELPDLSGAKSG